MLRAYVLCVRVCLSNTLPMLYLFAHQFINDRIKLELSVWRIIVVVVVVVQAEAGRQAGRHTHRICDCQTQNQVREE